MRNLTFCIVIFNYKFNNVIYEENILNLNNLYLIINRNLLLIVNKMQGYKKPRAWRNSVIPSWTKLLHSTRQDVRLNEKFSTLAQFITINIYEKIP